MSQRTGWRCTAGLVVARRLALPIARFFFELASRFLKRFLELTPGFFQRRFFLVHPSPRNLEIYLRVSAASLACDSAYTLLGWITPLRGFCTCE